MRIVALGKASDNASSRYRVEAFRSFFESDGHSLQFKTWPRSLFRRWQIHRCIGESDLLLLQRRMLSPAQFAILRRLAKCVVFDFDDALFVNDSYAACGPYSLRRWQKFRVTVQAADWIVAGNQFLCEQAELMTSPEKISLIPTCVDTARYRLASHAAADRIQLVWIGSASTARGLAPIKCWLEDLSSLRPAVALKIICNRFPSFQSLTINKCLWSAETESSELADADIGLSWLPDDLWSRGKCGLKVLQYMAAGLPVVANPVGMHAKLVQHGKTGFLVKNSGEFRDAVRILSRDPQLRRRFGLAGRQIVERHYDVSVGAWKWREILHRAEREEATT